MAMRNNFRAALWLAFILSLSHPSPASNSCSFAGLVRVGSLFLRTEPSLSCFRDAPRSPGFHLVYNVSCSTSLPNTGCCLRNGVSPGGAGFGFFCGQSPGRIFCLRAMRMGNSRGTLSSPANRFSWPGSSSLLFSCINDLVTEPRQPLHFSRGYTWIPLFLLGRNPCCACWNGVSASKAGFSAWPPWVSSSSSACRTTGLVRSPCRDGLGPRWG